MVWPPSLLVALPESGILVLHFTVDVKVLFERGKGYPWPKPLQCPQCGSVRLWGHGFSTRYFEGFSEFLWVKRFRCCDCFAVHTCRPLGFLKGLRYCAEAVGSCLLKKITENRWVGGFVRQNQQYWYRCLRFWSSGRCNVSRPTIDSIALFFSEKLFPVKEHFAPLHL
jgi:hypothetical protein